MNIQKDKPFGYEYSKKFCVGDLVEWSGWGYDCSGSIIHNSHFGMILSMEPEEFNGRNVMFATVHPVGQEQTKKFIVFVLRKRRIK